MVEIHGDMWWEGSIGFGGVKNSRPQSDIIHHLQENSYNTHNHINMQVGEEIKKEKKGVTFFTTRGTFAADFEITAGENPKRSDGIAVAMARAPARDLNVIIAATLEPTYLPHLFIAKHCQTIHHTLPIHLLNTIRHISLFLWQRF